jgi:hypothetical protein
LIEAAPIRSAEQQVARRWRARIARVETFHRHEAILDRRRAAAIDIEVAQLAHLLDHDRQRCGDERVAKHADLQSRREHVTELFEVEVAPRRHAVQWIGSRIADAFAHDRRAVQLVRVIDLGPHIDGLVREARIRRLRILTAWNDRIRIRERMSRDRENGKHADRSQHPARSLSRLQSWS